MSPGKTISHIKVTRNLLQAVFVVASHPQVAKLHHATFSVPLLKRRRRENTKKKGWWVAIRTGRSRTSYHHGQGRLSIGRFMKFIVNRLKLKAN